MDVWTTVKVPSSAEPGNDNGVLMGRMSWLLFVGGQQRMEHLYALAGEAAKAIGAGP